MVPKISLFANSQNIIQAADFSANHPFHIAIERLSKVIWCPGERGRWFYERARGQYQVVKSRECLTAAQKRKFEEKTPPPRKFTKTELAKYLNSWDQLPHIVSKGAQKNFINYSLRLQEYDNDWRPDESFYRELIAKAILFKTVVRIVKQRKFSAYKANVITYLIAYLAYRYSSSFNLLYIWENQKISVELENLLVLWSGKIYMAIINTAHGRNVTEWCKKEECWHAIRNLDLPAHELVPPECT
jgi:hypothetical protein